MPYEQLEKPTTAPVGLQMRVFITLCRLGTELKFPSLFLYSAFLLLTGAQDVFTMDFCANSTTAKCGSKGEFCDAYQLCVYESKAKYTFGLDLTWWPILTFAICFVILVASNLLILIVMLISSVRVAQEWRRSDLALCFILNSMYSSTPMLYTRYINYAVFIIGVGVQVASSIAYGCWYSMIANESSYWAYAMIALFSLYIPERQFAPAHLGQGISWPAYRKHLRDAISGENYAGFEWSDLLASAPVVLVSKLTAAALAEEYSEMTA